MSDRLYPTALAELAAWCRAHAATLDEGRKRFMQFVVLESLADSALRDRLAFKGGNALRFLYRNPRGTIDLDFTADAAFPDDPERIRRLLDPPLRRGAERFGVRARVQRLKRDPSAADKTTPTYHATAAYQLPGDRHFADFDAYARPLNTVVELEISLNDVVCETAIAQLDPQYDVSLRVCTLEDILAEKLRALLQQVVRNRHRRQDVYDIARMLRNHADQIDRRRVGEYLLRKSAARGIRATRSAFDEEVRRRARVDYDMLFDALDPDFVPFDEAWAAVVELVAGLDIPP